MKYDVNYFINKFSAIPTEQWATGVLRNHITGQRCALGHCLEYEGDTMIKMITEESKPLVLMFRDAKMDIVEINNGKDNRYRQPTEKERILAALQDIKQAQEPEIKEIIRYVAVDSPIRKEAKELLIEKTN